jgi:NADPH-dependent glutamate synthase beta subunit-like oxidoreductase
VGGRIAAWVRQIEMGDCYDAWLTLVDNNPFPAIAGRICHHPCESACNREHLDETVGICSLERYVGDMALAEGWQLPDPATSRDKSIAVVGGGPAGLSAAYQLRRQGYRVVLFESRDQLGGLLWHGIPGYRLDKAIVDGEIQRIIDLGVEVKLRAEIGDSKALQRLRDEYDAVYLATGASLPKLLPNLDYDQPWVIDGADFLAATNAGGACELGQRVVVVGGGSAAMDVARSARRLGKSVSVLSLEPEALLPAQRVEVEEAREEGIEFITGAMMQSVDSDDDSLTLRCVRVEFEPGKTWGEFSVEPIVGSEFVLPADAVIPSIGQDADLSRWRGLLDSDGPVIRTDKQWHTTTPGIFAGGDVTSMDRFVSVAVGMGRRAADEIGRYLDPQDARTVDPIESEMPFGAINTYYHPLADRHRPAKAEIAVRLRRFDEVQQPLSRDEAIAEAARCFSCGTCIYCDNCYFYCPDMAITKREGGYDVKLDYCKGCGLCVAECPTGAVYMVEER